MRIGIIGGQCQEVSWQCLEHPTSVKSHEQSIHWPGARPRNAPREGARMERKQSPTLKEQKKSSSDKTFEIMREDICSFVKWENMTLKVPTGLGRDGDQRTAQWQGKGLAYHSTSSPCSWPDRVTGFHTTGRDVS